MLGNGSPGTAAGRALLKHTGLKEAGRAPGGRQVLGGRQQRQQLRLPGDKQESTEPGGSPAERLWPRGGRATVLSTCRRAPGPEEAPGPLAHGWAWDKGVQVKTGLSGVSAQPSHPPARPPALDKAAAPWPGHSPLATHLQLQQLGQGVPQGLQVPYHHRGPAPLLRLALLLRQPCGFDL